MTNLLLAKKRLNLGVCIFFSFNLNQWFRCNLYLYFQLWLPFCSAQQNLLSNFGRGQYEEQFCEIILNLDQWFRRGFNLKIFLFLAPMAIFNGIICSILVEGNTRNYFRLEGSII